MTATISNLAPMHVMVHAISYRAGDRWTAKYGRFVAVGVTEQEARQVLKARLEKWIAENVRDVGPGVA